jgi:hypothetical protein
MRYCHDNCNDDFKKTLDKICKVCNCHYSKHSICRNSIFLYVLCDGTHIKL